jgi:hypothetical protein
MVSRSATPRLRAMALFTLTEEFTFIHAERRA